LNPAIPSRRRPFRYGRVAAAGLLLWAAAAQGAILPEDRADMLYHYYEGGGVRISGPAVLVRKGDGKALSYYGHYYVDNISSASIDVEANASRYREERTEVGVGVDYLHGDATILSASYSTSTENDYNANTVSLGASHEMLAGMTVLSMGVSFGADEVSKATQKSFRKEIDRWKYRLGLSQVLTKKWLLNVDYEVISAEGFLNNPYRVVRINGAFARPESYPDSRASQALAIRALQYLDNRASLRYDYRYYTDDWGIAAHTLELGLAQYYSEDVIGEYRIRFYTQNKATFYADDFPAVVRYMARDKELSTFSSVSVGFKISWTLFERPTATFKGGRLSFAYNRFLFNYKDFTNYATGEPYSFRANVFQAFFSLFY